MHATRKASSSTYISAPSNSANSAIFPSNMRLRVGTRVNSRVHIRDYTEIKANDIVQPKGGQRTRRIGMNRKERERGGKPDTKLRGEFFQGCQHLRIHEDFRFSVNTDVDDRTTCEVYQRWLRIRDVYPRSGHRMRIFNFCGEGNLFDRYCRCFILGFHVLSIVHASLILDFISNGASR